MYFVLNLDDFLGVNLIWMVTKKGKFLVDFSGPNITWRIAKFLLKTF